MEYFSHCSATPIDYSRGESFRGASIPTSQIDSRYEPSTVLRSARMAEVAKLGSQSCGSFIREGTETQILEVTRV